MDVMERNELKQAVKTEFDIIIKETMLAILKKHNLPSNMSKNIIQDLCVWSNLVVDMDLN